MIVAAGRGERAGQSEGPKQYRRIGGRPVISRTIDAFRSHPAIGPIAVAIHAEDHALFEAAVGKEVEQLIVVDGGATRQDSVRLGLAALRSDAPEKVLIHDAARPFVDAALIDRVIGAIGERQAALPVLAVAETLKRASADEMVSGTVARDGLYVAQTPQGFPFWPINAAHQKAHKAGKTGFTDDAAIAEWTKLPVKIVAGSPENIKLTWAKDIAAADQRLSAGGSQLSRCAHRQRLRRACLRAGRPRDLVRRRDPAWQEAVRPLGRRRRAACADRRAARHLRRRRHRHAFPAVRSAMARRAFADIHRACGQAGPRARRADRQCGRDADRRSAEDRPASCRDGRGACRTCSASPPSASR